MNNNNDNNTIRLASNNNIWQCIKGVYKEVIAMIHLAPLTPELMKKIKERKSEITIIHGLGLVYHSTSCDLLPGNST